jgi:hypothetical protein
LNAGNHRKTTEFLYHEADNIIREYGNHPSFCLWSLGNELQGNFSLLDSLLLYVKNKDSRHLYTTTTFTFEKGHGAWPEPHDDFWVSQWTKKGWIRGQGIFDRYPAGFRQNYSKAVDSLPVPVITHEIGQYSVFPNLKEIDKYTGNLIPLNLMAVRDDLARKNRLDEADSYLKASGKLAAILYKEEIERALKTNGISGFQLLDLHDFPGQGTALVGLLDAFWDSKGLVTPEEFRTFCHPVVLLADFDKATYTNDETLSVTAGISNFSNQTIKNAAILWKVKRYSGNIFAQGQFSGDSAIVGKTTSTGQFSVPLSDISDAEQLTIELSIEGTNYHNSWHIWVYPRHLQQPANDVIYTRNFNEAHQCLLKGAKVLFNPPVTELEGLEGKFVQVFWSPVHFPNQPGTMGILCDPAHPAFRFFPTEMHSNWQWWDICKNAKTMELDSIAPHIRPLVRMVDNFYKNRNLGLIFEAQSEKGVLLVCSADLENEIETRPVARQLRYSLLSYMHSDGFRPKQEIPFERITSSLRK